MDGVCTTELAVRFEVAPRTFQYTLKSDVEHQQDVSVPTTAVSVKVTSGELTALDIETRGEGLQQLIQAVGGCSGWR